MKPTRTAPKRAKGKRGPVAPSATRVRELNMMELRRRPGSYLNRVHLRGEVFEVTRAGAVLGMLVPVAEWRRLRELDAPRDMRKDRPAKDPAAVPF